MDTDEKFKLNDALKVIEGLADVSLPDQQPCIEALSLSILYQNNFNTNFADREAYVSGVAKYVEEATVHADLNKLLEEGKEYAVMMYTWRCCSRTFPQVKTNEQENRAEIYQAIVDVLDPGVDKLIKFMYFKKRAIERFCGEVKRLCHKEKRNDFVSEAYLLTLGKFINMFAELDELKNMKSSIQNDYSAYRRASHSLKVLGDTEKIQESNNLSMFLATQNTIRDTLKTTLLTIPGYEDLFADIISICVHMYENKMYLEPSEKYMLVKVIAFGLFMIDHAEKNIYKMDQKRKINIAKIDRILKQLEIVPLYGDMQLSPFGYIKKSMNFDSSKWPNCESDQASPQSNILANLEQIREDHMSYTTELSRLTNEATTTTQEGHRPDAENKDLYELAMRGLQLMSSWTQYVVELYSWKLLNPTDPFRNETCPEEAEEYERSTRYNYSSEEKFAIIEVIAMIKGLQLLMLRMESLFMDAIRRHIYAELQDFVQLGLREPIRKSIKKGHEVVKIILMAVRNTCVNWFRGTEPIDDPSMSGRKDPEDGFPITVPRRNVGPSSTQLYIVRTMLESLIGSKNAGVYRTLRKHLAMKHVITFGKFHKQSFYWNYLLNFSESVHNCCNLSQLWYREFFLEMTMGSRVQFPIEMSMPWILADHVLDTKEPDMMEYILYPLDLYNDSAHYALSVFHQQFLYDEIEAEVNLCFDQFVYKLSDQIFAYYKHHAASIMLDKKFRAECVEAGIKISYPTANRYETLLKQRNVRLLGRPIDLNKLIAQTINEAIQQSLDVAISRFECGDITGIIELDGLIECNKLTHRILKEFLPLDEFADMLREANQTVTASYGRIIQHVIGELKDDFLPNFYYNSTTNRYIRKELDYSEKVQRDKPSNPSHTYIWGTKSLTTAYSSVYSRYAGFVGPQHLGVICRLLGYQDIAVVVEELLKTVSDKLKGQLLGYAKTIQSTMPRSYRLPRSDCGSPGVMSYYQSQLFEIIQLSDMRTVMCQIFREVGNAILFFLSLENALNQEEMCDLLHAAPFLGMLPKPYIHVKEGDTRQQTEAELKSRMKEMQGQYRSLHLENMIDEFGNQMQSSIVREGQTYTRQRLCVGLSMFEAILKRIKSFLDDPLWQGLNPTNNVLNADDCNQFHSIWSAIQYVLCVPVRESELTVEAMFGDSLNWAGCTIIVLMGQQKRFEALDFCYQILEANRIDKKEATIEGIQLKKMVERIRKFQILNTQIFDVLNKFMRSGNGSCITQQYVHCFQPPVFQSPPKSPGVESPPAQSRRS